MNLSTLMLCLAMLCLPLCSPRAVTSRKDMAREEADYQAKQPIDKQYELQAENSLKRKNKQFAFHPYGLNSLGQGNIF